MCNVLWYAHFIRIVINDNSNSVALHTNAGTMISCALWKANFPSQRTRFAHSLVFTRTSVHYRASSFFFQINVRFTWYDAFQKGGLFSDKKTGKCLQSTPESAVLAGCCS